MRILTIFDSLGTLTSSGDASGHGRANIADLDPAMVWKADAYAGEVWLKMDLGSAKALTAVFLNRANFPQARIQGHASDSWGTPSFNLLVDLVRDEAENRKVYTQLTAFNYQWLRILIPGSQALDSGLVPELGNLIIGTDAATPLCPRLDVTLVSRIDRFEPSGAGMRKRFRGEPWHLIDAEFSDSLANIQALPKIWNHAVLWADLGDVSQSWLVTRPDRWSRPLKNVLDAQLRQTFEERT